jgi:hypothetical protein|uniref:Pole-organizing protein PopZ n=1 Tax=uncultured Alphaproteobacteria bacterium TaxID=91750 RepID=A0A1B0Z2B2_9PROT|nr:hypothetical protein [uncultured Alphaproteobacteria bacterium]
MADETSQAEPSMEEILASIRRIISEGGEEEEKPDAARPSIEKYSALGAGRISAEAQLADAAELTAAGDEVLELTDEVDEHGNVVETLAPEQDGPAVETAETAKINALGAEPVATVIPAEQVMENDEPLIETITEEATAGAFAALASQMGEGSVSENGQKITPSGRTLEEHVLEMLRPMLREWLDKHLPQMVQRLVQREIDRIIHRSNPM